MFSWLYLTFISSFAQSIQSILKKAFIKKVPLRNIILNQYIFATVITFVLFYKYIEFINSLISFYILKAISLLLFTLIFLNLLKKYDISSISPLLNISPLILLLFSTSFLGERITDIQFLGILIIIISTYFLEVHINFHEILKPYKYHFDFLNRLNYKDILLIFSMLFFISITAVSDKIILRKTNVYSDLFITSGIITILLLIYISFKHEFLFDLKSSLLSNWKIYTISAFFYLSSFSILYVIFIPSTEISIVIPIKRSSTLFSALFGGLLFKEKHIIQKTISVILMILGIYLLTLK